MFCRQWGVSVGSWAGVDVDKVVTGEIIGEPGMGKTKPRVRVRQERTAW